jgi:hypothetical protein
MRAIAPTLAKILNVPLPDAELPPVTLSGRQHRHGELARNREEIPIVMK